MMRMATNYASATYTEIVDMQTINGKTSVIGIHTPQGQRVRNYLEGFFKQFRFFKYNGISSMVGVNAAQLPVDPLGLTGVQGTTDLMDPRDNLNPILFHGCHGEALNSVLDTIYSSRERNLSSSGIVQNDLVSATGENESHISDSLFGSDIDNYQEYSTYYAALTDRTWKKFGIQSGVRLRGLRPRVWKVARNSPLVPYEASADGYAANAGLLKKSQNPYGPDNISVFAANVGNFPIDEGSNVEDYGDMDVSAGAPFTHSRYDQYMTNGTSPLGYLPTSTTGTDGALHPVMLPKLFMGVLVLPPSYNVEQFLRFRITHSFSFKGFTASLGNASIPSDDIGTPESRPAYFNWIDYTVSNAKDETKEQSPISYGDTFDIIGGASKTISDGVA